MITNKIDPKLLLDIFTDGIEWSCRGFWGQINEYKWEWWYVNGDLFGEINPEITPDTSLMQMRDHNEEGTAEPEWTEWHDITLRKLEEATQWALENYNHAFQGFSVKNNIIDDIQYDGISADIILQRIVLGGIFYG